MYNAGAKCSKVTDNWITNQNNYVYNSLVFGGRLKYLNFWPFSSPIFSQLLEDPG